MRTNIEERIVWGEMFGVWSEVGVCSVWVSAHSPQSTFSLSNQKSGHNECEEEKLEPVLSL